LLFKLLTPGVVYPLITDPFARSLKVDKAGGSIAVGPDGAACYGFFLGDLDYHVCGASVGSKGKFCLAESGTCKVSSHKPTRRADALYVRSGANALIKPSASISICEAHRITGPRHASPMFCQTLLPLLGKFLRDGYFSGAPLTIASWEDYRIAHSPWES